MMMGVKPRCIFMRLIKIRAAGMSFSGHHWSATNAQSPAGAYEAPARLVLFGPYTCLHLAGRGPAGVCRQAEMSSSNGTVRAAVAVLFPAVLGLRLVANMAIYDVFGRLGLVNSSSRAVASEASTLIVARVARTKTEIAFTYALLRGAIPVVIRSPGLRYRPIGSHYSSYRSSVKRRPRRDGFRENLGHLHQFLDLLHNASGLKSQCEEAAAWCACDVGTAFQGHPRTHDDVLQPGGLDPGALQGAAKQDPTVIGRPTISVLLYRWQRLWRRSTPCVINGMHFDFAVPAGLS
ncbi:hypothetical protein BC826DRAFT_967038 [Russula brevipes]|nr:hypothetical protein BC826DRAFT_967038 [Russula brevipes]